MNGLKGGILRWAVNTASWSPTRAEWIAAMRLVCSDEERIRINRFVYKRDAKHALVGRLLIRKCCDHFLGPGKFGFGTIDNHLFVERSDRGKPILVESRSTTIASYQYFNCILCACAVDSDGQRVPYDRFQFNISHSGD